jgi:acetolactate synthase-1/2/3 large subunit
LVQDAAGALARAGADVLFGVPGGGVNLAMIGAAEAEGMRFVLTHTEAAAACMAGVYAELTRTPAGCVVTRGPGAASSINGVAQAMLDRQPVIVLSDTVPSQDSSRVAHQRLDQSALFAPVTKWSTPLGPGDVGETVRQAADTALLPRPGPVHLNIDPSATRISPHPSAVARSGSFTAVDAALARASRPVVLVGMGARYDAAAVRALVSGTNIPVLQTYKAKGLIADSSPNAAGLLTGAQIEAPVLEAADLILAIGLDTVELIPAQWPYAAPVVSLTPWPDDSQYCPIAAEVVGPLDESLAELRPLPDGWDPNFAQSQRASGLEALVRGPSTGIGVTPWDVVRRVRAVAPPGSVATVDAGAHMLVAMPLWSTESPGELLVSSGLATMGFALPAAIAAALATPDARVFCFVGDGGLGMVLAELETLARLRLPITVVVFNDSSLSLIKIKQSPVGQGGETAVSYRRTDFAAIAEGCGVPGTRVNTGDELDVGARESLRSSGPILLDVLVDPTGYDAVFEAIRGRRTLTQAAGIGGRAR